MVDATAEKPRMNADERGLSPSTSDVNELTERVIGCAFAVSNALGAGFLEKVYENALAHEIKKTGLTVQQQKPVEVTYDGAVVGTYVIDLLIDHRLVLELKAVKHIDENQVAQTINYLRATGHHVGLILNFAKPKLEIKRLVHRL
ncbi:MAG: GxxExxY protein [Planctomycetota bacterium]